MTIPFYTLSVLLMIALPIALAIALRRRARAPWWLFCVGVATFAVSQAVHLPLNNWLGDLGILSKTLPPEGAALARQALILGLTAGLSEELARAVGYWLLSRRGKGSRPEEGVMLGLGHGGIEAMTFGAVLTAATITSLWALRDVDLESLNLAVEQLAAVRQQMELFAASPWLALVPLLERAIALTVHVSLSLLVWAAFKRRSVVYVGLAILYHTFFDAVAVYLAQDAFFAESVGRVWLLEGSVALLALPGALWIWHLWGGREGQPRTPRLSIAAEIRLFAASLRKEMLQQWRTKRLLVVSAVFTLFGLISPLIANFTPELLRSISGAEQFADLVPTPTTADALGQYIKNITQFGFIIAVLQGMGAVAGEKEKGTAALILSKPLPRWAFLLSKFSAQALVYLLGFALAALGAYYYTLVLFEPLDLLPFLFGNLLLLLWLLAFAAVTLLGSAVAASTGAAAAIALAGAVALLLAGSLPRVGALAPSALVSWAGQLGLEPAVQPNGGALVATIVVVVVCLLVALAVFEVQEL